MQNFYTKPFLCIIPVLLFYMIRENYWIAKIDENVRNRKVWVLTAGFLRVCKFDWACPVGWPVDWNHKSKLDLSTELSTDASTDLPSAFYRKERVEDMRLNQQEPEDENSVEDIESEKDSEEGDEIKARFDRRLKILKRACSVLPQLRGANDVASHNQLIRIGFDRTECSVPFTDDSKSI